MTPEDLMSLLARLCRRLAVAVIVGAALAAGPAVADAPPASSEDLIRRMFEDGGIDASWIAPIARAQLTPQLVRSVVAQVNAAAGELESVAADGHAWLATFERGSTTVILGRDENGLVNNLYITDLIPRDLTLEQVAASFAELPGETALLVTAGGEVLAEHNADAELLIGSAFKLAVLQVVREQVDAGTLAWDQVVRYDAADASLPSGMLQAYPDGHPITVASLAAMMISLSDNTATDVLIDLVGREEVEAAAGLAPLLKTSEFFKLKADAERYQRYVAGTVDARRQILAELAVVPLPHVSGVANGRTAHGWRIPVRKLCELIAAVDDIDLMTINTGGVAEIDWERIAFKGGNDVGATNLTYMLTPAEGPPFCVSLTWNDAEELDDAVLMALANRLFHVLRERS
jgi:hypothetical protein